MVVKANYNMLEIMEIIKNRNCNDMERKVPEVTSKSHRKFQTVVHWSDITAVSEDCDKESRKTDVFLTFT